ncbi:MAG: HIT family protein [Candidatus Saccharimonadales bacterium]
MSDTIFTKIIKGELPCHRVYEDDKTIAFMDIHPVQPGMVLVVAKNPVDQFMDLPDEDYIALMLVVKTIAQKMRIHYPGARIGVQIEGLDVPHAHVKLIPIYSSADFHASPDANEPDHEALESIAKKLAA